LSGSLPLLPTHNPPWKSSRKDLCSSGLSACRFLRTISKLLLFILSPLLNVLSNGSRPFRLQPRRRVNPKQAALTAHHSPMIELEPHPPENENDGCCGYGHHPVNPEAGFEDGGGGGCFPVEEGHCEEGLDERDR
jgi:hypothetical protein